MKITVINLTPHDINVLTKESCSNLEQDSKTKQWIADSAEPVRIIKSSGIARVLVSSQYADSVDEIPVQKPVYGKIEGLPEYQKDIVYIVSLLTVSAARAQGRTTADLYTPGIVVRSRANQSLILGAFDLNSHI